MGKRFRVRHLLHIKTPVIILDQGSWGPSGLEDVIVCYDVPDEV